MERKKAKLGALELNTNSIAQRYAEEMLGTGEFKSNPELPSTMGENIKYFMGRVPRRIRILHGRPLPGLLLAPEATLGIKRGVYFR